MKNPDFLYRMNLNAYLNALDRLLVVDRCFTKNKNRGKDDVFQDSMWVIFEEIRRKDAKVKQSQQDLVKSR